jgi:eukaryotic-like serine/threonine-protein kinase
VADDKKTQMGTPASSATAARAAVTPNVTPAPVTQQLPASDAAAAAAVATSYLPTTEDPLLGKILADRYHIVRKLGEGGMGAVYLATHRLLEKSVALKVLHGEFARKPDLVERFMQEAKSASRIRHENVIDISDFGVTSDGLVFFAMELLKGHDLHEEIAKARAKGEPLPWERSRPIFLQICAALEAAHGHGIIHRDLKPENIYLVDFLGQPDFVKLLDFGIAKMTEVAEGDRKLTRTGMLFGTPEYMSPEQARGENADVRVDVYAMACILFQLITLRVPFEADNFMSVLTLHLMEPPPVIPTATLDLVGAPHEIAAIINKGLAKDRKERWQSIAELADAIRALHGEAPPSHSPSRATAARAAITGPVSAIIAVPTVSQTKSDRWTGSVRVADEPQDAPRQPQQKSKAPLFAAIGVVAIAGGVAAFVLTRPKNNETNAPTVASGQAPTTNIDAPVIAIDAAAIAIAPPLQIPSRVIIHVVTVPAGAAIFDPDTGRQLIKTPDKLDVLGSAQSRYFVAKLKGYKEYSFEVARDRNDTYTLTLEKGSGKSVAASLPKSTNQGSATNIGSAAVAAGKDPPGKDPPGKGSDSTTKDPIKDPASNAGSNKTDPVVKPGVDVPDDPDLPVPLKGFGGGSGSN